MRLILGGAHQNKLAYVLAVENITLQQVVRGEKCALEDVKNSKILYGFHLLVRRILQQGGDPAAFLEELLRDNPEIIIITDETGCGIVPIDAFEREWREVTGRLCCILAQRASRVERVFCGIATVIKEGRA